MPLYEYHCSNCGQNCEILQKIGEKSVTTCPNCQQDQLQRQVSAPSFQLKGTGWYVTDFKNKDKPKPAEKETTKETDSAKPTGESTKSSEEKS